MEDIASFEFEFKKFSYDEYYRPLIEVDVMAEDEDENIIDDSREKILLNTDYGRLYAINGEAMKLAEHFADWREASQPDFKERLEKNAAQIEKDLNEFLSDRWLRNKFEKFETDFLNKDDALCDLTDLRLLKVDREKDQAVFTVRVADERPVNLNLTLSKLYDFDADDIVDCPGDAEREIEAQLTAALGADKVSDIICVSIAQDGVSEVEDRIREKYVVEVTGMDLLGKKDTGLPTGIRAWLCVNGRDIVAGFPVDISENNKITAHESLRYPNFFGQSADGNGELAAKLSEIMEIDSDSDDFAKETKELIEAIVETVIPEAQHEIYMEEEYKERQRIKEERKRQFKERERVKAEQKKRIKEAAGMTEGPGKVYISLRRDQFVERNELEKLGAKRDGDLWSLDESKVKDLKNEYELYRDKELTQRITVKEQAEIKPRGRGR